MMYKKGLKRIVDFIIAIVLLIFLFPVFFGVYLLLIISQNSAFFTQHRPGKNSEIFKLIKFKTMNDKHDENGKLLPDAVRLTPVGKFIRSTSLDELPQLINDLKGDTSLIGPRPLLVKYLPLYSKEQARRHNVRPGITGWAQVNGRNTISLELKIELNVLYVDYIIFLLDIKTLDLILKKGNR